MCFKTSNKSAARQQFNCLLYHHHNIIIILNIIFNGITKWCVVLRKVSQKIHEEILYIMFPVTVSLFSQVLRR